MLTIEHRCTATLGGHVEACRDYGQWRITYNSCRDRHCRSARAPPQLAKCEADLLSVGYFHVVFTLPAEVADIPFHNKALVYDLLFRAASETMMTMAVDPRHLGARIGITGFGCIRRHDQLAFGRAMTSVRFWRSANAALTTEMAARCGRSLFAGGSLAGLLLADARRQTRL